MKIYSNFLVIFTLAILTSACTPSESSKQELEVSDSASRAYRCSGDATRTCSILNGTGTQSRTCSNGKWSSYSTCTLVSCNSGYVVSGNTCVPAPTCSAPSQTQSCTIANGTGSQTKTCSNGVWTAFSSCAVVSCNSGYVVSGNTCVAEVITSQYKIGDVIELIKITNVRQTGSLTGVLLGQQPIGARGKIIAGPTRADNITWWQVDFDSGVDGITGEDNYKIYVAPTCSAPSQTQSCSIANGTGSQTKTCSNGVWTAYSACAPVSCNSGFELVNGVCTQIVVTQTTGCNCGSVDSLKACTGTSTTRVTGGIEFKWEFNCNGAACQCGQFATGEYWVAAKTAAGQAVSAVTITEILPSGLEHGAMANPEHRTKQGLLTGYPKSYLADLNIMTKLPYSAVGGTSIIKARTQTTGCGTTANAPGCVTSYDSLTVLASVPANAGSTVFRPPFYGTNKPEYSTNKIRFERLPSMPDATGTRTAATFAASVDAIVARWTVPHYDIARSTTYFDGEFYRATSPIAVMDDYAAGQAQQYLSGLFQVYGTETPMQKRKAVIALMQRGIDIYAAFKLGIPFGSGAGQHLGKKPPLVFFAAMYDDASILEEVRSIATNPYYLENSFFQEDSQLSVTPDGKVAVWGGKSKEVHKYWNYYKAGYMKDKGFGGDGDANGSIGDPYAIIDGPAGSTSGKTYQYVTGGPMVSYAFAQHLMPYLKYAAGDWKILQYADRYFRGRGFTNFNGGFWAANDECAALDLRENLACRADRGYLLDGNPNFTQADLTSKTGCAYYMITWGPDVRNPGKCIKHNKDPNVDGRWSHRHGTSNTTTDRGLGYLVPFAIYNWDKLRDCADPAHATYPCPGLGPAR